MNYKRRPRATPGPYCQHSQIRFVLAHSGKGLLGSLRHHLLLGGELCSSNTPGLSSAQTIIAALLTLRGLIHDPGAGENTAKTIVLL